MPALDTNCLVRLFVRDNPVQTALVTALLDSGEKLHVNDVCLIETGFVLSHHYGYQRAQVAKALAFLIGQANLVFDRSTWESILTVYQDKPGLSLVDIYLAKSINRDGHDPLYTFDKKMQSQLQAAVFPPEGASPITG